MAVTLYLCCFHNNYFLYHSSGVTLDLQPESKMLAESEGVVEVCVSLSGELETSVNAMVFTVPGDAKCEEPIGCRNDNTCSFILSCKKQY